MLGQVPLKTLLPLVMVALGQAGCDKSPAAPTAAAATPAARASGAPAARVETDAYAVTLMTAPSAGTLTITARPPLHINPDYPAAFRPDPGGVTFEGERVALGQELKKPCAAKAEDTCEATSTLRYTGGASGTSVSGTVQFSVCEPEKCLIEKVKVASAIP
jgi:hypothetical protein